METLGSIIKALSAEEKMDTLVVVFIAEVGDDLHRVVDFTR